MQKNPPPLLKAVTNGGKNEVARLLKKRDIVIDDRDTDGVTPLMEAAANNHISILALLLEHRADVNIENCIGRTALMEAACRGHPAITLRLCQARPNLNYYNVKHPLHLTCLMEAASRGHTGVVFWLCEARADLNMVSKWNDTALILAAHNNRYDTVRALVAQRANVDIRGDGQLTALETALSRGFTRIVSFLSDSRIRDPAYCDKLYAYFKDQQKRQLQEEVNYDAAVSSRKPFPEVNFRHLPRFSQLLVPIEVPRDRACAHPAPHVPTNHKLAFQKRNKPRRVPLKRLPRFHYCRWVAIEPTRRLQDSRDKRSVTFETNLANYKTSQYPLLTLFDNGTWSYTNDQLSGDLDGTYTIAQVVSHGTMKHIKVGPESSPQQPPTSGTKDGEGGMDGSASSTSSTQHTAEDPTTQGDRLHHLGFSPADSDQPEGTNKTGEPLSDPAKSIQWKWENQPFTYQIQLETRGHENAHQQVHQRVDFMLGKQIVLGRLVLEMDESMLPWWLFYGDDDDEEEEENAAAAASLSLNVSGNQLLQDLTPPESNSRAVAAPASAPGVKAPLSKGREQPIRTSEQRHVAGVPPPSRALSTQKSLSS